MSQQLMIRNLMPGLTERGKIKIGEKGRMVRSAKGTEFQPPQKLDHFRVTTLERGPDGNYLLDQEVHQLYGEKPRVLPVRLLYNEIDLNFQSRYCAYKGKTLWCSGDGETAYRLRANSQTGEREAVKCPCIHQDPTFQGDPKCKINGTLSVIIDGVSRVGGVWKFRTTSYNSVVGIMSSLALMQSLTGGSLAGLPLQLTLNPKTAIVPTSGQTMQIWIVGLEFKGSVDQLQQISYERAKQNALHHAKMEQIEKSVRALITYDPSTMGADEVVEIVEEFYPEQAVKGAVDAELIEAAQVAQPGEADESTGGTTRRARRNKFQVDPNDWNGKTEISTCGSTPEQLAVLRRIATADPANRVVIKEYLSGIGYEELSFLRADEAEELLKKFTPEHAPEVTPEGTPEAVQPAGAQTVECPARDGDRMYVDSYCKTNCPDRKRDGWCPIIEEPPVADAPMF